MSLESEREEARETLKYRVVEGYNPRTRGVVRRSMIVERETLNEEALVNYALKIGYVRGKSEDICGILRGLLALRASAMERETFYYTPLPRKSLRVCRRGRNEISVRAIANNVLEIAE